jgi:hypothetical protein
MDERVSRLCFHGAKWSNLVFPGSCTGLYWDKTGESEFCYSRKTEAPNIQVQHAQGIGFDEVPPGLGFISHQPSAWSKSDRKKSRLRSAFSSAGVPWGPWRVSRNWLALNLVALNEHAAFDLGQEPVHSLAEALYLRFRLDDLVVIAGFKQAGFKKIDIRISMGTSL